MAAISPAPGVIRVEQSREGDGIRTIYSVRLPSHRPSYGADPITYEASIRSTDGTQMPCRPWALVDDSTIQFLLPSGFGRAVCHPVLDLKADGRDVGEFPVPAITKPKEHLRLTPSAKARTRAFLTGTAEGKATLFAETLSSSQPRREWLIRVLRSSFGGETPWVKAIPERSADGAIQRLAKLPVRYPEDCSAVRLEILTREAHPIHKVLHLTHVPVAWIANAWRVLYDQPPVYRVSKELGIRFVSATTRRGSRLGKPGGVVISAQFLTSSGEPMLPREQFNGQNSVWKISHAVDEIDFSHTRVHAIQPNPSAGLVLPESKGNGGSAVIKRVLPSLDIDIEVSPYRVFSRHIEDIRVSTFPH